MSYQRQRIRVRWWSGDNNSRYNNAQVLSLIHTRGRGMDRTYYAPRRLIIYFNYGAKGHKYFEFPMNNNDKPRMKLV